MKNLVILGSTGSIGTQTLDVVRSNPNGFKVVGLACGRNIDLLKKQIEEFNPSFVSVELEKDYELLKSEYKGIRFSYGRNGLVDIVKLDEATHIVNALMGIKGLEPTYYGILSGKDILLANKETLVTGGELITRLVKEHNVNLLPIDSEHSAILQCLEGNKGREIKKIILTCSGGPFRGKSRNELESVNVMEALNHPKWSMGKKITIDSATLMNKGLEVIEAKWLFDVDPSKIEVVIHPESILHSAVEYMDNSIIGQLGNPDMRIPISLALGYPNRINSGENELSLFGKSLTFLEPDYETFGCLKLALDAIKIGGSMPIVLNAANEVLVQKFLDGKINFLDIEKGVKEKLYGHKVKYNLSIEEILEIDNEVRKELM